MALRELEEVELRALLARVLQQLSGPERALLQLRYIDDLTQRELAQRLGLPEGTAKVRLHRLRIRLRAALDDAS